MKSHSLSLEIDCRRTPDIILNSQLPLPWTFCYTSGDGVFLYRVVNLPYSKARSSLIAHLIQAGREGRVRASLLNV